MGRIVLFAAVSLSTAPAQQGPRATAMPVSFNDRAATASLSVRVKDQADGLVADARVLLLSDASMRRVAEGQTNNAGETYFPQLEPGSYAIQVEFPGFSMPRQSVLLAAGALSEVDVSGTYHDGAMAPVVAPPKHSLLHRLKRVVPKVHF